MLPDFTNLKKQIGALYLNYLHQRQQDLLGFWSQLPSYKHEEGNRWTFENAIEGPNQNEYETIESILTIEIDEVPNLTQEKVLEKLDVIADELARKMLTMMYARLNKQLELAGRITDAGGRPFTKELFLENLQGLSIDFDEQGKSILPSIIIHPNMVDHVMKEMQSGEKDDEFIKRHEAIIQQKRMEWRDRESRRKLVD